MTHNKSHDNGVNLLAIAHESMIAEGFTPDVPANVEQELRTIDEKHIVSGTSARDLRNILWSSIDNVTSRDLDQVEFVEKLSDDSIKVLIGSADVDAFAPKDSDIDHYAYLNTTSVYTGVTTNPSLVAKTGNKFRD